MRTVKLLTCSHPQLLVFTVREYVGLKHTKTPLKTGQAHKHTFLLSYKDTMKCSIVLSCWVHVCRYKRKSKMTRTRRGKNDNSATYSWEEHISHYSTMCTTGNNSGENRTKMSQGELSFHIRFFCATQEQQEQETCILMFWLTCLINEHHSFFYSSL